MHRKVTDQQLQGLPASFPETRSLFPPAVSLMCVWLCTGHPGLGHSPVLVILYINGELFLRAQFRALGTLTVLYRRDLSLVSEIFFT